MIARYSREPMARLCPIKARFEAWWKVELAVLEARAERGEIPPQVCDHIRRTAQFSLEEIAQVEADVQHDVIAFLTVIARYVGPDSRYIHQGLTSSDILDSAFALQIKDAASLLMDDIAALRLIFGRRAREFRDTAVVGRTHGIHAEPTVFGLKFALWEDEFSRHETRLWQVSDRLLVGSSRSGGQLRSHGSRVGRSGHESARIGSRTDFYANCGARTSCRIPELGGSDRLDRRADRHGNPSFATNGSRAKHLNLSGKSRRFFGDASQAESNSL